MVMRLSTGLGLLLAAASAPLPVLAQTAATAAPPAAVSTAAAAKTGGQAASAGAAPSRPSAVPASNAASRLAEPGSRIEARSTASQMAAGIVAAEAALTPEELAIAEQVHQGVLPCELGQVVQIHADPKHPGYFDVRVQRKRYRMFPVLSRTGAIRLEDHRGEALWIQLANKSMFIDRKLGRRLADECMSPAQAEVASALRLNPRPGLLDAPAPAMPVAAGAAAGAVVPATPKITD